MTSFLSQAKLNLGLQVLNKRKDDYHNIRSCFIEIDLEDTLDFSQATSFQLSVAGTDIPVDESNLISKAYRFMRFRAEKIQTEFSIHLKKRIPIGSGLGGGSSNAAVTLNALNQLWHLNLSAEELEAMGTEIGADVPFFIKGGIQLVEGIGDVLTPIDPTLMKDLHFILVVPPIQIATPWAYRVLNKTLHPNKRQAKFPPLSKPMKWELFDNDFERVIHETYPEIREIKANLQKLGALYAGLSGSGSTVFGVFDNLQKAEPILEKFTQYQTYLTSPVFR